MRRISVRIKTEPMRGPGIKDAARMFVMRCRMANPNMAEKASRLLSAKVEAGTLRPKDLFRFSIPIIQSVVSRSAPNSVAALAAKIQLDHPLPLWIDKKCYFDPFYAGVGRTALLYYFLPKEKRGIFMGLLQEKNPLLFGEFKKALEKNIFFTFAQSDEERKDSIARFARAWDLSGERAYTRRARYWRLENPPRSYIIR